jgi:hypothetical protein
LTRQIIGTSLATHVGAEILMNSTFEHSGNGLRLTGLVTLLALVSAVSLVGCHSHSAARGAATSTSPPIEASQTAPASPNPLEGMEPVQPFDQTRVTTMETVGASDKD